MLAVLDVFGTPDAPLTYRAASLQLVVEGALVVALLAIVVDGTRLSPGAITFRLTVPAVLHLRDLDRGLWLLERAQQGLPWHERGNPPDGQEQPRGHRKQMVEQKTGRRHAVRRPCSGSRPAVTLAGGIALERLSRVDLDTDRAVRRPLRRHRPRGRDRAARGVDRARSR